MIITISAFFVLFSTLLFVSPLQATTFNPVEPFWLHQADSYIHYTFDSSYTIGAPLNSTLESAWGSSTLTTLASYDQYGKLNRDYQLVVDVDPNPSYDRHNPGSDEKVYMWLDFTYFYSGGGGLSWPTSAGTSLTNDERFDELAVDADLNVASVNLDYQAVTADGGAYRHLSIMWQVRQLESWYYLGDNADGWTDWVQFNWGAYGDNWYLTDVRAATISYQAYNPNPVPLPAAAWLFTSGLLGLFAFKRHQR